MSVGGDAGPSRVGEQFVVSPTEGVRTGHGRHGVTPGGTGTNRTSRTGAGPDSCILSLRDSQSRQVSSHNAQTSRDTGSPPSGREGLSHSSSKSLVKASTLGVSLYLQTTVVLTRGLVDRGSSRSSGPHSSVSREEGRLG